MRQVTPVVLILSGLSINGSDSISLFLRYRLIRTIAITMLKAQKNCYMNSKANAGQKGQRTYSGYHNGAENMEIRCKGYIKGQDLEMEEFI